MFNNREISIAFWTTIFICWAFSKKEIRRSILDVIKSIFQFKVIFTIFFLFIYSFFIVILLKEIHIWKISNLKETIYWFIFSCVATFFIIVTDKKTERPFRKVLRGIITFTVILEFIVNTYVFNLIIELFFWPAIVVLSAVYTFASLKTEYKAVEKFLETLLVITGVLVLVLVLVRIYYDFEKFASLDMLIAFIIPPILTITVLPAIYLMLLYFTYEELFVRIIILLDSKENRRYAKKLSIIYCGCRVSRVKYMLKTNVHYLYNTATKEEIKKILLNNNNST